ncbi:MAG TPA: response regulator transcription factor [Caulobacteraceae bacterium]|nr:response regulator transcription factor [Caulobacteraceae bacterium]
MRLLLIEDNRDLATLLAGQLAPRGFEIDWAPCGADGLEMAALLPYPAIVLDLGLPDMDGLEVLRRLRQAHEASPVLILTARGQVPDRVKGLEAGADDYLVKPFAYEELVARLNVLVRRKGQPGGERLEVGNISFATRERQVEVAGRPHLLSAQELNLLEILMRRSGRVVAKRHLDDQLFGLSTDVGPGAVEVAVYRLRRRLKAAAANVEIHTIRGVGYMIAGAQV